MNHFQESELTIQLDETTPGTLRLHWLGMSTHRAPITILKPWFDELFTAAGANGLAVEMDFVRFEHMNSSTISALVHIIHDARDRGVPLTLRYDAQVRWQKLSFDALSRALRPFNASRDSPVTFLAVSG